jgi:gas vesicle protein
MKLGRYIVGLLSGLTFGVLFAPKKGKQLRNEIFKKGSENSSQEAFMALVNAFRDAGMDAASEIKKLSENEQLTAALSMSKEKMREYLSHLEDGGYDVAARAQEKLEELSDYASDTVSSFKKRAVRKGKKTAKAVKKAVRAKVKPVKKAVTRKRVSKKSAPRKRSAAKKK